MRIQFSEATLQEMRWRPIVEVILLLIEDGRHWIDLPDIESVKNNYYAVDKTGSGATIEMLKQRAKATSFSAVASGPTVQIDPSAPPGGKVDFAERTTSVPPLDAVYFLSQPFAVVLENDWYDGGFLLWMAKALNYQDFLKNYRLRRFEFKNAGGKTGLTRSAQAMSTGVWPLRNGGTDRAFRLWNGVMLDSDAKHPDHAPNASIREECSEHSAWVVELKARSIENYLPLVAMLKAVNGKPPIERTRVRAYFNMSDAQRRHFHMKSGFAIKGNDAPDKQTFLAAADVPQEVKNLYSSVPDHDWAALAPGFGSSLSRIYSDESERPDTGQVVFPSETLKLDVESILKKIVGSI